MLGSPASPRKRPFELLSDLVDDGGFGEDLHPERWDVSALDEMTRFTKLGLGVGGELLACSEEAVLMGHWGRSCEEEEEEESWWSRHKTPAIIQEVQAAAAAAVGKEVGCNSVTTTTEEQLGVAGRDAEGPEGEMLKGCTVEVYQVAQDEDKVAVAAAGLAPEPCNEHNYSLSQEEEEPTNSSQTEGGRDEEQGSREEIQCKSNLIEDEYKAEDEDEEEEDGVEETDVDEAVLLSSSETECGEFPPLVCLTEEKEGGERMSQLTPLY